MILVRAGGRPIARAALILAGLGLALALRLDIAGGFGVGNLGASGIRPIVAAVVWALLLVGLVVVAGLWPRGDRWHPRLVSRTWVGVSSADPLCLVSDRMNDQRGGSALETPTERSAGRESRGGNGGEVLAPRVPPYAIVPPYFMLAPRPIASKSALGAGVAWGLIGAAVLVAFPLLMRLHGSSVVLPSPAGEFGLWAAVITLGSAAEEVLLRGVLFAAIEEAWGISAAVVLAAVAFALVHVPLYGPGVVPLDLAVGLWLGTLRAISGGVTAPAMAHALADLATWWLV